MKIKMCILLFATFIFLPINVFASGSIKPSTSSLSITEGSSSSFTITANNSAGRIDISTSNNSVASVNVTSRWMENDSVTVTVNGNSTGSATITVKLSDAATFDEEELTGSYNINVNVNPKSSSNTGNNSGNNNKPSNAQNNISNLSKNNEIENLEVENYNLTLTDGIYYLTVRNSVTNINIIGKPKDNKATIDGIGNKELVIGENIFDVIVTSESGDKKNYTLKITRKDNKVELSNILEEIESNEDDFSVIVNDVSKIVSKNVLDSIKKNKKVLEFSNYDENNNVIYSWIIDGEKLQDTFEFNTFIDFKSSNIEKLSNLTNFADGLTLNFEHNGKLPKNTKIRIYVGNKYKDGDLVNVYKFEEINDKLKKIKDEIEVKEGYVEFELESCSEYFVTKAVFNDNANKTLFLIISIIELIVILLILILDFLKINPILKLKSNKSI